MMLFSITLILILLFTGWFPTLAKESKCSVHTIYLFLFVMIMTYFLPMMPLVDRLFVHLGWILLLIACLFLFYQIEHDKKWWFLSIVLSSASIAFSFHEIFHVHTDWSQLSFRIFLTFLFAIGGLIAYQKGVERICYLWGGLIVTDSLILFAHTEMLNPIIIGGRIFLDTCWMMMLFSLLIQFGINLLSARFRKERF